MSDKLLEFSQLTFYMIFHHSRYKKKIIVQLWFSDSPVMLIARRERSVNLAHESRCEGEQYYVISGNLTC